MLGKKNSALADDEIEMVSGGDGLPDGCQYAEVKCPYCPKGFRYFITDTGNKDTKQIAEGKLRDHVFDRHRSPIC